MAETIRIGNVEIIAIQDCAAQAPWNALFPQQTQEQWEPHKQWLSEDGKTLSLSISSFVVRSQGKTILIDTGIGAKDRPFFPNGRLPDALRDEGIKPEDIDIVACTHMHIDHVGWHTTKTETGEFVATFPNAKLVFVEKEWNFFTDPDFAKDQPHIQDSILPIKDTADIVLVDGEHKLTDDIVLVPTPGHTVAHSSYAIVSNGEAGIIWGDVCHHPAQVTELWSPVFDMNPALSQQSREKLLQRIEDERMQVIAGHFQFPGFGRIVRIDGKRHWQAN